MHFSPSQLSSLSSALSLDMATTGRFIMTYTEQNFTIWTLKGAELTSVPTLQHPNTQAAVSPCGKFVACAGIVCLYVSRVVYVCACLYVHHMCMFVCTSRVCLYVHHIVCTSHVYVCVCTSHLYVCVYITCVCLCVYITSLCLCVHHMCMFV